MDAQRGAADDPAGLVAEGALAYVDDRLAEARSLWEQAFRGLRESGRMAGAARVATLLGELHWGGLGNASIGRGWLERAKRLLDEVGPCVEQGYWELARLACDRPDVLALQQAADRAMVIAAAYQDIGLHTRALADGGFALVCQGRLQEGFARLEEALAALSGGEVTDPFAVSTSCCALLSACDRAGDAERATEWLRAVHELVLSPGRGRPRMLSAHCHVAHAGVLWSVGRFADAEVAIAAALDPAGGATAAQRIEATARLSELRLAAGRVDEAAELLTAIEDQPAASMPLALVHLTRDEPRAAAAVLRRSLEAIPGDALRQARLLHLMVDAELALGNHAAASETAARLSALARSVDAQEVAGHAAFAQGLLASASDATTALGHFETAETIFASDWPVLAAEARLAAAQCLAPESPDHAIAAARAVHATAVRLGVTRLRDRSAALLRQLGASAPRPLGAAHALSGLTPREADILDGLRRGESNATIAARVYLAPKTVEHHVSRLFVKLGVRTRAEAAALAAAAASTGMRRPEDSGISPAPESGTAG